MKKIVSFTLALLLICTTVGVCFAETPGTRSSSYFYRCSTGVSDAGNGVLSITFSCIGMNICSQLGVASYSVERRDNDGNWENVTGLLNGETGSNVVSYTFGRYFYGVSGETYRVNVIFLCVIDGGAETKSQTSYSITME